MCFSVLLSRTYTKASTLDIMTLPVIVSIAHILCECEALASLRHAYLGSFFLEPEDIKSISLEAIWNFNKATGLLWFDMGHKGPLNKA